MAKFFELFQSGNKKIEEKEKIQQPEKSKEEEQEIEERLEELKKSLKPEEDEEESSGRSSADFDNSTFYEKESVQRRLNEEKEKVLKKRIEWAYKKSQNKK